jgi:4'-phosphopantetheinyl transferase
LLALARRFYHPAETAYIAGLADDQQRQAFFRLWTLKEAFFKALGTGLATGLQRARFDLTHEKNFLAELAPELHQDPKAWQFYATGLGANYHCALAAASHSPVRPRWLNANELLFGAPAA